MSHKEFKISTEKKFLNSPTKVAVASFVGTTVEFYDFYIYGLAAALYLGPLFFPSDNKNTEIMAAFLTFGIAFIARPIGSVIFGHFGDKFGRKSTLVTSLMLMGVSTTVIGFLPAYASAGLLGPILLCAMRFGQGLGLGGEWGGAALLATENAPAGKRALFGMFPQIGPPVAFIIAGIVFITLENTLNHHQMMSWGWRIPFILSFVLVMLGLYVRLTIIESPIFQQLEALKAQVNMPFFSVLRENFKEIVLGSLVAMSCFILFFLITVFSLDYQTTNRFGDGTAFFSKTQFLLMLMVSFIFMAAASPISAYLCERIGRKTVLIYSGILTIITGLFFGFTMNSGSFVLVFPYLSISLFVMGLLYTPLASYLPEIFPSKVRYTGSSITFSLGGILGGSLTPFIANLLSLKGDLSFVGIFLSVGALISLIAVILLGETKHKDYSK